MNSIFFHSYNHPKNTWLSVFYNSPIIINKKSYRTVAHYYQACKAASEYDHERIREEKTPTLAKRLSGKSISRRDWELVKVEVMKKGLLAKFQQHEKLKVKLLETGNKKIFEDSPYDKFWGWHRGDGENKMGELLMEVRDILKQEKKKYNGQLGQ